MNTLIRCVFNFFGKWHTQNSIGVHICRLLWAIVQVTVKQNTASDIRSELV